MVWLAFGVALLLVGIALKIAAGAACVGGGGHARPSSRCSCIDLAGVQGIYRALSFIGLGLVLMGIGWLYQRLLFPPQRNTPPAPG